MHRTTSLLRLLPVALIFAATPVFAQSAADFQSLEKQIQQLQQKVDKLQREQADSTVNYSGSASGAKDVIEESKIKLASAVTELKLFGDLRMRYQADEFHPVLDSPALVTTDRNRYRFRLRIGADVKLGDQFFAGVTLATGQQADSNNQTYTEGYDNYNIYIDKAFMGWTPNDWLTVILGKQANPLYTTNMVWDPNITPQGAVETVDLTKAFEFGGSKFSLQLVSLQGAFYGGGSFSTGADTAWQFVEQLKGTYHFNKDVSVTFAPGFMTYTNASLSGLQNAIDFSKSTDALTAASSIQVQTTTTTTNTTTVKYDSKGSPTVTVTPVNTTTAVTTTTPATGAARTVTTTTNNNQAQVTIPFGAPGNPYKVNPALANKSFVTTTTTGGGTNNTTTPVGATPSEETKDLAILTAPGDISFKLGGIATKLYWDFAYNTEGSSRSTNEYFLPTHSSDDDIAWLAGIQLGGNDRQGDWSLDFNYRQVGMDSIDPNLNSNNFALSYLNTQGIQAEVAYNFTDSLVGAVTYYYAWQLNHGVTGGEATGGAQLGNARKVDVLQVDLSLKF